MVFVPKTTEEVLSGCKRLHQMHQCWWKTHKLKEILTVSKVLLLFSMSLIIHFVHKYTDIGKVPCLRKLIEVWYTALLLLAIPLASCFDFSGTSSFSSSYLAEDLVGSETSQLDPSTVFKNQNVILGSCDIWQHAHSEMSPTEVVSISTISPGFRCPPARGTEVSRDLSIRHRPTFSCTEIIHTFMHFNPNLLTLSSLWNRGDTKECTLAPATRMILSVCLKYFWDIRLWPGSFSNKIRY